MDDDLTPVTNPGNAKPYCKLNIAHYCSLYYELRTFARKFSSRYNFFKVLLQAANELLVSEMHKKLGVTVFVSEIKRVVNYTDFEKLSHIIEHGLQGYIVKNIECKSKEANDLNYM